MRSPRLALLSLTLLSMACGRGTNGRTMGVGLSRQSQAVTSVCPGPNTLPGVDVSDYDSANWPEVRDGGIVFGIARISDGLNFPDTQFAYNWKAMADAGVIRGAYQFYEASQDPIAQANMVVQAVGRLGPTDLPVAFDMESGSPPLSDVQTWMSVVEAGTGKVPMVYTGLYFWDGLGYGAAFANLPLWVANYGVTCPGMPEGWDNWTIWQSTGTGTAAGISSVNNSDLDEFNGTLSALLSLAEGSATTCGAGEASCSVDGDCCIGLSCQTSTCQAANACTALWGSCSASSQCCADTVCLTWTPEGQAAGTFCCDGVGQACSSSRGCCGGTLCASGVCQCVPSGSYCQNDADCCSGLSCQSSHCETAPATSAASTSSSSSASSSSGGTSVTTTMSSSSTSGSASTPDSTSSSGTSSHLASSSSSGRTTSSGSTAAAGSTTTAASTSASSGATAASSTSTSTASGTTSSGTTATEPAPDAGSGTHAKSGGCASTPERGSSPAMTIALATLALRRRRRTLS